MARTIDERIVQMTFNNQEFERRANTTISTLGKLTGALNPNKLANSLNEITRYSNRFDLSGITTAVDTVNQRFRIFEEIATGALRRVGEIATNFVTGKIYALANSLTSMTDLQMFDQGYQKYNDLTASVQTLVNSTGKSVEEIDGYLKRLMWYSDETSFGFTDMSKALGTMVSSGGDIDKLIPMLMGIGNAVAYAGKGAAEFQRAIFNLNQSYSLGYLTTRDWYSLSNASADTKELKLQLLGAAVELDKISKKEATLENFSSLMSDKVFSRDVMEKAFGNFAKFTLLVEEAVKNGQFATAAEAMEALSGSTEKFAENAFIAGQSAKSFKEAVEATQDAVSSGWMQTFQLVFGDYNESKALWTDVTNTFWEIFASGAKRRNDILEVWKEQWKNFISVKNPDDQINPIDFDEWKRNSQYLTQTQALVGAISDAVLGIRNMISDVFRLVFPIHTILNEDGEEVEDYSIAAKKIFEIVESVRHAFIRLSEEGFDSKAAVAFRRNFMGILEVIKTIGVYAKSFVDNFVKPLKDMLKPVLDEVVQLWDNLGKIIINTAQGARKDLTPFETFLSNVLKILSPIINLLKNVLHWINQLISGVKNINIFDGIFTTIWKVVEFVSNSVQGAIPVFKTIGGLLKGVFENIKNGIQSFITQDGSNVAKIAEGGFLGYLAYGLYVAIKKLQGLDISGLLNKFSFQGLANSIKDVFQSVVDGINNLLGRGGSNIGTLKQMADALLELAAALVILSLADNEKLMKNLTGLAFALGQVVAVIWALNKMSFANKSGGTGAKGLKGFFENLGNGIKDLFRPNDFKIAMKAVKTLALVVLELSIALKILASIEPEALMNAVIALGVVLLELVGFIKLLSLASEGLDAGNIKAVGKSLTKLGFAMIELSLALKIMASMDGQELKRALISMGVALTEIAAFVIAVSRFTGEGTVAKLAALGPTMIGIGFALIEIAAAMKLLGTMDQASSDRALVSLLGALGTIMLFTLAISNFAKGGAVSFVAIAAGMLVMATAIGVFTIALSAMAAFGWDGLKEGLKVLAAMMGTLALSGVVLGVLSPLFLLAAVAMTAFGDALYVLSSAMLKAVTAFAAFQMIGSEFGVTIIKVLTDAFTAIIALIPSFIIGIVQAVIGVAGELINLVGTLINVVLTAINEQLPTIIQNIVTFVSSVLSGLISAIDEWAPLIFTLAFGLINTLITQLRENLPTLLENLMGLLIDAINGLAEVVRSGGGALGEALGNLAGALIEGIFGAIGGLLGGIGEGIVGAGKGLWEGISGIWSSLFSSDEQAEEQEDSGAKIVDNVTTGMDSNKKSAYDKADEIGNETAKKMEDAEEAKKSGVYTLDGLIEGLMDGDKLNEIFLAGKEAGKMYMKGYNSEMDQHSPSRKMEEEAGFTIAGLIRGFKQLDDVKKAGNNAGEAIYNSLVSSLSLANEIMDESLNPVITPVIDLSEIQANKDVMQGLFGSDLAYNGALSVQAKQLAIQNQNADSGPRNDIEITMNNTFSFDKVSDLDDTELNRIANKLANKINTILGNEL